MVNVTGDRSLEGVRAGFVQFANTVFSTGTPLCRHLSLEVAEDDELIALAAIASAGQYPPYLLFAAVQYLLLDDDTEPLVEYFPTLRTNPFPAGEAFPAFREFCIRRAPELRELVSTRLVQTNEVGRAACLVPAFAYVSSLTSGAPLHLIDVGAAGGLNLCFDRYLLDFGRFTWGDTASVVRIPCELADERDPPLRDWLPNVSQRIGVDVNPIDLRNENAARWLRSLVWPDLPRRMQVLDHAIAVVAQDPPAVVHGDATAYLPELLARVEAGEIACVYQSYALEYFAPDSRQEFQSILDAFGHEHDLYFVEMSGIGESANVRVSMWRHGERTDRRLGQTQPHGGWLKWLA